MPPVYLEHPSSLAHLTGSHPERPERIRAIEQELERSDWFGLERRRSQPVERAALLAVHSVEHVERVEAACAAGGGAIDAETILSPGSFEAALHGAGGAVELVELLLGDEAPWGISAHRPPGHHATRTRAMGFCLFNSIAVAAQHALDACGCERVLILDWDVHHGNGTHDIFYETPAVLFVSIHQSPLYPGTGGSREVGSGKGTGYTVNLPVAAGSGDAVFRSLVEHVAIPLARQYEPQLLLISAGFDAHAEDPLADCTVTEAGFAAMAGVMREFGRELAIPLGLVLEGGYALGALARSVAATLSALSTTEPVEAEPVPVARDAHEARERLKPWWPELRG